MKEWGFSEDQVIAAIKKHEAKKVLLQFPDGLKMHSQSIRKKVLEEVDAEVFIWEGSNFGACDLPLEARQVGVDLIIHFGHTPWNYKREVVN